MNITPDGTQSNH